jgi:tagaturonate epimerase
VWNKSYREHSIIGTSPDDTRQAANDAVQTCGWQGSYYVDADHIGLKNVTRFLGSSNFFTIDVADFIGETASAQASAVFLRAMAHLKGSLRIPLLRTPIEVTNELLMDVAEKYLSAVEEAGRVYRYIEAVKGPGNFVAEISVDEASEPQTPEELLFLLGAIARERIPIQTIAPKFSGSFLKGVDYVGDVQAFSREFHEDLAVIAFARETFDLPRNLKLSIHSGSDKFSLYPVIHRAAAKFNAGFHLKTAGTTWLEEVIGIAASGGPGLEVAKLIYAEAYKRFDEMTKPYLSVVAIDRDSLPDPEQVNSWSAEEFVEALQHDQTCDRFNPQFRQLVHVGYKVAAEMGTRFTALLQEYRDTIELHVTENIFRRHVEPLFLGHSTHASPDGGGDFRKSKNARSANATR